MYPRNAASPPRIAVGAVVKISDGTVESSGVSIAVRAEGGAEAAGTNSPEYGASSGIVYYTPTQAETNYTAFVVTAYKTGCIPVSVTVVTTASSVAGKADVGSWNGTAIPGTDTAGYPKVTIKDGTGTGELDTSSGAVILQADQAVNVTKWGGTAVASATVNANITQLSGDAIAADNAEAFFDGTGYAGTNNVIPTVTTLTNLPSIPNDWITAAGIAQNAIDADAISSDAITEIQSGLATSAQVSAIGSGTGAALNFEVSDDNTDAPLNGITFVGDQGATTFANTQADNNTYHTISSVGNEINLVYKFACGGGRNASKVVLRAFMTAVTDTVSIQVYDHVGTDWETVGSITGTTETLHDIPLYVKHTGTGASAGIVYIRFVFSEADAGELNIDLAYVQAQNLGQTVGYANGSIWVSSTGTSGTTPYVNGTGDNPCPWADAVTLSTATGIKRFTVTPGSSVTLGAAFATSVVMGRGYALALGGQNISGSYFEGVESLSGTGTTATAEAIFKECHIGTVTLGEFDFVKCHLHGTVTLSAASKYYRMHDCTGIENATIEFGNTSQTLALSKMSGNITVTGMGSGDTIIVDGEGLLTIDATCTAGTVYISGAIRLTNNGSGQTVYDSARWDEGQNITNVTGTVNALDTQAKADVNAEVVDVLRTDTIPDSYSTDGSQPTIAQAMLEIRQFLMEKAISSTTMTVKKPDGTTSAMTFTLSDATNPVSITRAS